jgi:hypothetical protein
LRDLSVTETRALLLLRVLSSFYIALASSALAALASLIGAVTSTRTERRASTTTRGGRQRNGRDRRIWRVNPALPRYAQPTGLA